MIKLLVVDDENDIRNNIVEYFRLNNFNVQSAENGKQALAIIENFLPDIIISDMLMPEMDGIQFLEKIRENKSTSLIPFLMLTAKVENVDYRKSMNLGADDYIAKPFDFKDLDDSVQSQLKKKVDLKRHIIEESHSSLQYLRNIASQEIFTPINALQNILNIIKIDTPIDSEMENIFILSLRRLKKTLNNLLIISGVQELNNNFVHYSREYLYKFIKDSISDNINYTNKNLKINHIINIPNEFYCREYSLIVLSELIENAVKYADDNTELKIDIQLANSTIIIEVINYCSNIPQEFNNRIKAIYQNDRSNDYKQGSGLGLYLINTLVDKYNDQLTVEVQNNEVKFNLICQSNH